jgi:hypothetical protein
MKVFVTALSLFAFLNLTLLEYSTAGEVQKKPLDISEMVSLTKEQAVDFGEMQEVEAGLANGYGLLTLAFAIGVGYLISKELDKDDEKKDKSSSNNTGTTSRNETTQTTTTTDPETGASTTETATTTTST